MTDKPSDAPAHCPGTQSNDAGKASPCQGCPNQQLCSSGTLKGPDPDVFRIKERLAGVKHKILVLSEKGGVGKTSVSCCLSRALALDAALQVGLLDIDICGPSVPVAMGLLQETVHQSAAGWSPVFVQENLAVMSVGFLLSSPDEAVVWRGPKKNGLIKQFLRDVDWGGLDFLLVDTPPGTSDEHLSVVQLLGEAGLDGAVIVSSPQEVALLDVRKEVTFCRKLGVPVLGVVENLSSFTCPKCSFQSDVFPATSGGVRKMCADMSVPFLGSLPIEPGLARTLDRGECPFEALGDTPALLTVRNIAGALRSKFSAES